MGALDGRVAVVTGAGRGLGRDYAKFLGADGAAVVVSDVDEAGAKAAADEVITAGGRALGVGADVSDPASVEAMVAAATDTFGRLDILVNNAGIWGDLQGVLAGVLDTDVDYWKFVLDVNLTGTFLCSKAAAPTMVSQGWGRIINVSSIASRISAGVYGVSKLAVAQLTFATAHQLGGSGITVNCIAPGTILNEATRSQMPQVILDGAIQQQAVKRGGTSADLYSAISWLCGTDTEWITGQTIHCNGGALSLM